jgi:Uma2 family endonuclease
MRAPTHHRYTWNEYLAFERTSNVKHEFCEGEIFAMAGGTPTHAVLGLAVGSELRLQLAGRDCRAYSSDLRIRVPATGLGTYPDATVICGRPEADPEDENTLINPIVLVEVLSASTEAFDRGEKLEHYQQIPSLREYVLVSWREPLIEVIRREDDGRWRRFEARRHGAVRLESIDCALDVDRIYAGVDLG